jgi:hypothetical protein
MEPDAMTPQQVRTAETEKAMSSSKPSNDVPFDFDTWAALSARLLNLGADARIDVLEERGVALEDWLRSDEHHCLSLAADVSAGRMERAERYGRMCAEEMERRAKGEPEVPAPHAEEADAVQVPDASAPMPVLVVGAPAVGGGEEVPSFLHTAASLDGVGAGLPPLVPPSRGTSPLAGTMKAPDLPSFVKQASANPLPFGEAPSPEFLASLEAPRPSPVLSGATIPGGVDLMAQLRSTLPFAKQNTGAEVSSSTKVVSYPRLPLETYASLCAELSVFPERTPEILAKYGIRDEEARVALDADWKARLSAHPDTCEEWRSRCASYEAWLRKGSR